MSVSEMNNMNSGNKSVRQSSLTVVIAITSNLVRGLFDAVDKIFHYYGVLIVGCYDMKNMMV